MPASSSSGAGVSKKWKNANFSLYRCLPSSATSPGRSSRKATKSAITVIADFVAFLDDLPGDVADEGRQRYKEKFAFFHFFETPAPEDELAGILIGAMRGCVTVC